MKIKQTNILKNSVIYGANASGKSNLIATVALIKATLLGEIPVEAMNDFCKIKSENETRESTFELQFTVGDHFYAYGFAAVLSQRQITAEWLYELKQTGGANLLFEHEIGKAPVLGKQIKLSETEQHRFFVYSEDFANQNARLFLSEMNRGKTYDSNSKLYFFREVFGWLVNNIIVITPNVGLANAEAYYNNESLESISNLIQTFDTGVTNIKTKKVTAEEISKLMPIEVFRGMLSTLRTQMQMKGMPSMKMSWRFGDSFFNISMQENSEVEVNTLVLTHGKSEFDFEFREESDGTKRLLDLVDMLLTDRPDTVFVVDELERSLHPKLTQHFLELFAEAHQDAKMQLIFTTHEDTIMDLNLFRRDEIWFIERTTENNSKIYSLDRFKERYDKKLGKAYLEGRYGAIPVFKRFSFKREE